MVVKITAHARAKDAPAKSAIVKRTVAKKPVQTAPAKKAASRSPATKSAARGSVPSPRTRKAAAPVVKDTPVKSPLIERRENTNPKTRAGGLSYKQLSDLTGYGLGSERFIVAVEIVKGAATRQEINHRVAALLPATTRNGTPKAVSNLVSGVIKDLQRNGFTVSGTWKMVAPKA